MVSSTNVTFTFARASRNDPQGNGALAAGAVAANAMLYPRVLLATAVLNAAVVTPLAWLLAAPATVAMLAAAIGTRRSSSSPAPEMAMTNPLQLTDALRMAALFQGVQMAVHAAGHFWGSSGLLTSAAILGLTDVDALTISMARSVADTTSISVAAFAIAVGVMSNTGMKLGLALFFGSPGFRWTAGSALLLMLVAAGLALAFRR